ncbi:hypothetical protein J2X55_001928 [Microbacterium sp. 1154]|uniref:hypothetical protein n=1 Tax=Microbacterium sp. 1154 TaxID=2817733 RepID=UPI000E24580E|nr:hypothetical protein [Microbacterium sp. 1154]MDR6691016.1 hypothetical protein [Microbacterium sp. 1154]
MSAITQTISIATRPTLIENALLSAARAMSTAAERRMGRRADRLEAEPSRRAGIAASRAMSHDVARYLLPR